MDEINVQVYTAFMALTSNGAFDMVIGARTRSVVTTQPPLLLREFLNPGKSTVENLRHIVEKFEEGVRRYYDQHDHTGTKLTLNEYIRMASLEALLPGDVERRPVVLAPEGVVRGPTEERSA